MAKLHLVLFSCCLLLCKAMEMYSGYGLSRDAPEDKPVVLLGGLFPVHANEENICGDILDLGVQRLEAMVLATELINSSPDLLPGVTLGYEIRDTCVQGNIALEESLSFVRDRGMDENNSTLLGISGVVGAASSGVSIVVANLLRLFQVPQISYASTAKILSDKTRFDYFFRTVPPDSLQAKTMADIIFKFNWTYIHAVYSDDAYGSEGISAFFDEIEERNSNNNNTQVCIASVLEIPQEATRESVFDEAVRELNQEWVGNSSVVVLFGQLSTAIGILSAVRRIDNENPGFAEQFTWIGSDAWGDQLPSEFHSTAKGMLSVSPKGSPSSEFDKYFTSLNPINYTANPWFTEYWEFYFNCSFAQSTCDPTKQIISEKTGYRQNSKVTFTLDAVYAFAHAIHNLIRSMCPDEDLCDSITEIRSESIVIRGDLLLESLRNVSFNGFSAGTIQFDSSGDEQGDFVIKNLKKTSDGTGFFYDTVGSWSPIKKLNLDRNIEWNGADDSEDVPISICSLPCSGGEFPEPIPGQSDCCWLCQPCLGSRLVSTGLACSECAIGTKPNADRTGCVEIVPDYLKWNSPWAIVLILLTMIGFASTAMVVLIVIICYKHPIIKASSRELSFIMLVGLALCYIMPFFFIAKPSIGICTVRRFGVGIAFTTCYGALLIKTNRIYRIFKRARNSVQKPPLISPQSQIIFTFFLIAIQVVIVVIWVIIERPSVKVNFTDFEGELLCGESAIIGFFIHVSYNFILLCLSTVYGVLSRKIPQSYNESKLINFTVFSSVLVWMGLVPTYFTTALVAALYQTLSLMIAVMMCATIMLSILFLSKVYFLISRKRKDLRELQETQMGLNRENSANASRKFSMDLLNVRSPRNQQSLLSGPISSIGSFHSQTLNKSTLSVPKTGDVRSISSANSIGSNPSRPCSPSRILTDAFTQTSDDEKKSDEVKIMMDLALNPEPVCDVYVPVSNDELIVEALRIEIEAEEAQEKAVQEGVRMLNEGSSDTKAIGASDQDAEKSSVKEASYVIEGLDTIGSLDTTVGDTTVGGLDTGLDTTIGDLDTTVGDLDTTVGDLDTTVGDLDTTVGDLDTTVGGFDTIIEGLDATDADPINETSTAASQDNSSAKDGPNIFKAINVCAIIVTDEGGAVSPVEGWGLDDQ